MHRPRFLIPIIAGILATFTLTAVIALTLALPDRKSSGVDGYTPPPLDGCHEVDSSEMYVQRAYDCGSGERVITFVDAAACNDYLAIAEHFGAEVLARGVTWARIR